MRGLPQMRRLGGQVSLKFAGSFAEDIGVAAESGERRAARMRELAEQHATKAENYLRVAERIEKGNAGEHKIAAVLDVLDGAGWVVLNDRYQSASSRTNIDHILVGPPGVCVIDSKNWSGDVRLDHRGISVGKYRRDGQLVSSEQQAAAVDEVARTVISSVLTAPVLAFAGDVGLAAPVYHQRVMLMQAEQLLPWLTQQPKHLTPQQVHQLASALDAAFPPRDGPANPFTLSEVDRYRDALEGRRGPVKTATAAAVEQFGPRAYLSGWYGARPVGRAFRQAARGFVMLAVGLIAVALLLNVGVPLMQKGLTDAIPKIFPTPGASPRTVVTPQKKPPVRPTPEVTTKR